MGLYCISLRGRRRVVRFVVVGGCRSYTYLGCLHLQKPERLKAFKPTTLCVFLCKCLGVFVSSN